MIKVLSWDQNQCLDALLESCTLFQLLFFFFKQARAFTQKSTINMTQSFRKNLKASLYLHLTSESESGAIFRVALLIFSQVDRILTGSTKQTPQMLPEMYDWSKKYSQTGTSDCLQDSSLTWSRGHRCQPAAIVSHQLLLLVSKQLVQEDFSCFLRGNLKP